MVDNRPSTIEFLTYLQSKLPEYELIWSSRKRKNTPITFTINRRNNANGLLEGSIVVNSSQEAVQSPFRVILVESVEYHVTSSNYSESAERVIRAIRQFLPPERTQEVTLDYFREQVAGKLNALGIVFEKQGIEFDYRSSTKPRVGKNAIMYTITIKI